MMMQSITLLCILFCFPFVILAQGSQNTPYTFSKLTQEIVEIITELNSTEYKNWGDTLISIYKGCSLETIYFKIQDNLDKYLDGNNTSNGLYLNKQYFGFYADTEKNISQTASTMEQVFEFKYLGKKYLCFIFANTKNSFVYNVFDITNPEKITQSVMSSNRMGSDSFGDFDFDGRIDFVSVMDYTVENFTTKNDETGFKAIVYTFDDNKTQILKNDDTKQAHYIIGIGNNPNIDSFMVLHQDWLIPLKSPNKVYIKHNAGGWEPNNNAIYTVEGQRVEIKKYSIIAATCYNEEEVKKVTNKLSTQKIQGNYIEVYVKMEIVKNEVKWLVLVGNYYESKTAKIVCNELEKNGYKDLTIIKL